MRFKVVNYSRLEIRLDTLHIYSYICRLAVLCVMLKVKCDYAILLEQCRLTLTLSPKVGIWYMSECVIQNISPAVELWMRAVRCSHGCNGPLWLRDDGDVAHGQYNARPSLAAICRATMFFDQIILLGDSGTCVNNLLRVITCSEIDFLSVLDHTSGVLHYTTVPHLYNVTHVYSPVRQ